MFYNSCLNVCVYGLIFTATIILRKQLRDLVIHHHNPLNQLPLSERIYRCVWGKVILLGKIKKRKHLLLVIQPHQTCRP